MTKNSGPAFHDKNDTPAFFHFERPRLNELFMQAVKYPMVLVCAGAGYGKTIAVHDFTRQYREDTAWVQLSERDNVGSRFWENFTATISKTNKLFAKALSKIGFPDTIDKLNQYNVLVYDYLELRKRIIVMDDFHFIEDPAVIRFVEHAYLHLPPETSLFLVSRSTPRINTAGLVSKGLIFNICEDDLRFSENELMRYFNSLDIHMEKENGHSKDTLREIMQDTEGWAFAINLIAWSYSKAPGYTGYLRTAMKTNIFRLMETEIWNGISNRLQNFLISLSLIDHFSVDLVTSLAGDEKEILCDLEKQNAYVRRDAYINSYLIHPLFLEFLAARTSVLSEEQKNRTYAIAGDWCNKNGFRIDAMSYFEKIGDYKSIVDIFVKIPAQVPQGIAHFAEMIIERAPQQAFDTVKFLASSHIRSLMCQGQWEKSSELAEKYEARFLKLPKNDFFRECSLASIYYCWGFMRAAMNLYWDLYDYDLYFQKFVNCVPVPFDPGIFIRFSPGPWICTLSSSEKGAPEKYIGTAERTAAFIAGYFKGYVSGEVDLAWGELKFYRDDISGAEVHIAHALDQAWTLKHYEIVFRCLLYSLRIAVIRGNYKKAGQVYDAMKSIPEEDRYHNYFNNNDIFHAWFYYILDMPENVPEWIHENFSPYSYAGFIENFANQLKARYCYMTRNYPPLLSYIQEMKRRESFLFGRSEMLAMEACVYYKMDDKKKALAVLAEAYETTSPNDLIMPYIEMGKDMRTLTSWALREQESEKTKIPKSWLENINRRSSSYAKHLVHFVTGYKLINGMTDGIAISPRESEILTDLSHGLSRTEIASSQSLSINTVKMIINNIYKKLGAENLADAIRIATERKIIS